MLLRTAAAISIINLTGNRINQCMRAIMISSKHPEEEEQEVAEEEEEEAEARIETEDTMVLTWAMGRVITTSVRVS